MLMFLFCVGRYSKPGKHVTAASYSRLSLSEYKLSEQTLSLHIDSKGSLVQVYTVCQLIKNADLLKTDYN